MIKQYDQFTKTGGQFGPDTGVNLLRNQGGQLRPKKWGQFAGISRNVIKEH